MSRRTIGITEARRLLPSLVESVARDGGQVDITHRGKPLVSLVRTSDIPGRARATSLGDAALKVEMECSPDELFDAIRALRATTGSPRSLPARRAAKRR